MLIADLVVPHVFLIGPWGLRLRVSQVDLDRLSICFLDRFLSREILMPICLNIVSLLLLI